jgi:hypothetical protein
MTYGQKVTLRAVFSCVYIIALSFGLYHTSLFYIRYTSAAEIAKIELDLLQREAELTFIPELEAVLDEVKVPHSYIIPHPWKDGPEIYEWRQIENPVPR